MAGAAQAAEAMQLITQGLARTARGLRPSATGPTAYYLKASSVSASLSPPAHRAEDCAGWDPAAAGAVAAHLAGGVGLVVVARAAVGPLGRHYWSLVQFAAAEALPAGA